MNGLWKVGSVVLFLVAGSFIYNCPAPSIVAIGNGTQQTNGTYLNAQRLANSLVSASITVQATGEIDIDDNIDLSYSPNGPVTYNLTLSAPTLNLTNNILFSTTWPGTLILNAQTVNLNGTVTLTNGTLLSGTNIPGRATNVNVLSRNDSVGGAF